MVETGWIVASQFAGS